MTKLKGNSWGGHPRDIIIPDLFVSIVTYSPDINILADCLRSLVESIGYALGRGLISRAEVVIVDNGPGTVWESRLQAMLADIVSVWEHINTRVITGHGNVGFGAGHNLVARSGGSRYCLVLNPDVILTLDAIANAVVFMDKNNDIGLLTPYACDDNCQKQFLCKRYPALFDLLLCGFAPSFLKNFFKRRLARYKMRELIEEKNAFDIPMVSGCFMFLRRSVWGKVGGFDPGFFLYFEDFDLSLRIGMISKIAYVPLVKIKHFGGNAARKGSRHIMMFLKSALRFYQLHGFKFF